MIKTIRDIISLNPLYKEFLAQLMEGGKKVADNPVHLADFGKENPKHDDRVVILTSERSSSRCQGMIRHCRQHQMKYMYTVTCMPLQMPFWVD